MTSFLSIGVVTAIEEERRRRAEREGLARAARIRTDSNRTNVRLDEDWS